MSTAVAASYAGLYDDGYLKERIGNVRDKYNIRRCVFREDRCEHQFYTGILANAQ